MYCVRHDGYLLFPYVLSMTKINALPAITRAVASRTELSIKTPIMVVIMVVLCACVSLPGVTGI
jgi:hypothetical protein